MFFWTFYSSENPDMYNGFPKNIKQHRKIVSWAPISVWEWFLKDHVTIKTGVMAAENSALKSQE